MSRELENFFLNEKPIHAICAKNDIYDVMKPLIVIMGVINFNNHSVNWFVMLVTLKIIMIILIPCVPTLYKVAHRITRLRFFCAHIVTMSLITLSSTNLEDTMFHLVVHLTHTPMVS